MKSRTSMARVHRSPENVRHAWVESAGDMVRSPQKGDPVRRDGDLTEGEVRGEAALTGLLVFRPHVLAGLGERGDGGVEIDAVPGLDLVARDHVGDPRLHRAEGAALDAGNLD